MDKKRVITSTESLELKEIPKHLIIIGGGFYFSLRITRDKRRSALWIETILIPVVLLSLYLAYDPFTVGITWVAFEPTFTDISALPFRPTVGENVSVFVRVANEGLLDGNLTVSLRDDEGTLLQTESLQLTTGEWSNYVWEVEAWKTGRLGLTVEIENITPRIPVPLADMCAPLR